MKTVVVDGRKPCALCGEWFPATPEHFHSRQAGRGLNAYCKPCARTRALKHYRANHAIALLIRAAYRETHREQARAYFARRRAEKGPVAYRPPLNPEQARAKKRAYYQANVASHVARARAWAARNPEKAQAHSRVKRFRRRGAEPDQAARAYMAILVRDPCSYCGRLEVTEVDHIRPLSAGGRSDWSNLTAACGPCNRAKASRSLLGFLCNWRYA